MNEEITKEIGAMKKQLGIYMSIEILAKSEGGQNMLRALRGDMRDGLTNLFRTYKEAPDSELRASIALVHERFKFYQTLKRAKTNAKITKADLDQMLSEIVEDENNLEN